MIRGPLDPVKSLTPGGLEEYFRFGPFRDPAGCATVVYLDNLARGASNDAVDPSKL